MRPFEIALMMTNLLALLISFRPSAPKLGWVVLGLNWAALLAHALSGGEGLRYQMAFFYAYVGLLTIFVGLGLNRRFSRINASRVLRITASALVFLCISCTAILAISLPVFKFEALTGRYTVGVKYFYLIDKGRTEPFLHNSSRKRELMVKVY
jgi:hypothetical protein